MPTWTRASATLTMTSPLGPDKLIPIALDAHEAMSQPFYFDVRAVSQAGVIDSDKLLNQPVCVTLQANGIPLRHFHGIVRSVAAEGPVRSAASADDNQLYRLSLVPRLWFLGQTIDCRVYQKQKTDDILRALFQDAGLTDLILVPSGTMREYTVQFNESDLQFATRLMEEEGWYYFFGHEAGAHYLIIVNQNSAFSDIPGADLHLGGGDTDGTLLMDFNHAATVARGKMKFKDYDPEKPDTLLQNEQPTTLKAGGAAARDDFRWPAVSFDNGALKDRTRFQMEAAEALASVYDGVTRFGGMIPGAKFNVASRPASPFDGSYVVRSTNHHASDDTWINQSGTQTSVVRFTAFPSAVTWREPMTTPRPRMDGVHTALVMGPQSAKGGDIKSQDGEEIHTDDLGRVKVRFYWDHRAEATGGDAIWARVIQPWAGNGWGAQFTPRVGTEVAVAFVDGDPDRPIVIGGLYNGRDKPIYTKADKTKLGFRSRSSLKGGSSEFNEFTFDDKKGNELVYVQAQKDHTTYVKHDQTLKIDNCRIVTVKQDETVDVQNNQTIKVKMDHKMTVTDGNHAVIVSKGNQSVKIDMGNHDMKIAMGNLATDVKMGNVSLKAGLGKIDNEAMQAIELKVGQSSLKIDQMGITLTGMMIKIEGKIQTQIKGLMTQVNGDAMLMVKGAITMIN